MSFSGGIESDFMKLTEIPLSKKPSYINFAATDFVSIRNSLIDYMKAVYPDEYQYFVESDLGMMFVELIAYMGSVMSLKADMLANENYFATARQRRSVRKLLELIGVRMRGPISATAEARLSFADDPPTDPEQSIVIEPQARVVEVESPEDGSTLSFTLYKVVNGLVDTANSTGNIVLQPEESDNQADTSSIYTNLALQEGILVTDSGSFDATQAIKSVPLTESPVVEGSVQVYITSTDPTLNGAYSETDNIYFASGLSDKIFQIVYDENYNATVLFGDGTVGANPDFESSYFIQYRVGGGTRGNVAKGSLNTTIAATHGAATINGTATNSTLAVGGRDAETIEQAKKYAPLTFRRQDRLVTLEDYATFASTYIGQFGTIGRATAVTRKAYSSGNTIDLYVLEKASDLQLQKATTNFKTQLLTAINKKKMATDEVVINDGLIRTFDLITTIRINRSDKENQEQITAKVRDKILSFMNPENRNFGQTLVVAELNREIFELDEVIFSTIDSLTEDLKVDFNEIVQLNNLTINVELVD